MRVLWLCNIMLPVVARWLGKETSNKEGWLTGLSEKLLCHAKENQIELGFCFPIGKDGEPVRGTGDGFSYFGFREDVGRPEVYDAGLEGQLTEILERFQPDVVHVFGTEYPHTLAMTRCVKEKEHLLIGLQGLCSEIAKAYMADLPVSVQKRYLLRDFLKRDNLARQQEKFALRGENEINALQNAKHVTGRTDWDKGVVQRINPSLTYHFMNETLRPEFYGPEWNLSHCERYSIFLSQGNYPLKGLHYLLEAMPRIVKEYPDTKVYVAGDVITRYTTLTEKIKIGSYGKYCIDLIRKNGLEEKVVFLGRLDSGKMCARYLKSHVFLCASSLENSPNSVGEAMLLGMPVVSAAVGGVPCMLRDKEEGLLYPPQDTGRLAEAVCTMFADDSFAKQCGRNAGKHALMTHDPETNYRRLLEIYEQLT